MESFTESLLIIGVMMAKQVIELVTDDLDGSADAESLTFGLDGAWFTIDLGTKNSEKLRKFLAPFIEVAAPTAFPENVQNGRKGKKVVAGAAEPATIRSWWKQEAEAGTPGIVAYGDRGRIPQTVESAFYAAHGNK